MTPSPAQESVSEPIERIVALFNMFHVLPPRELSEALSRYTRDDFAAILQRLRAVSAPGDGWRPIESAPKGVAILAWQSNWGHGREVYWCAGTKAAGWYLSNRGPEDSWSLVDLTHWQPLPSPPSNGDANAT